MRLPLFENHVRALSIFIIRGQWSIMGARLCTGFQLTAASSKHDFWRIQAKKKTNTTKTFCRFQIICWWTFQRSRCSSPGDLEPQRTSLQSSTGSKTLTNKELHHCPTIRNTSSHNAWFPLVLLEQYSVGRHCVNVQVCRVKEAGKKVKMADIETLF